MLITAPAEAVSSIDCTVIRGGPSHPGDAAHDGPLLIQFDVRQKRGIKSEEWNRIAWS